MKLQETFLLLIIMLQLFICGCTNTTDDTTLLSPATLIYMAADNNLDYYAISNIKQMEIKAKNQIKIEYSPPHVQSVLIIQAATM